MPLLIVSAEVFECRVQAGLSIGQTQLEPFRPSGIASTILREGSTQLYRLSIKSACEPRLKDLTDLRDNFFKPSLVWTQYSSLAPLATGALKYALPSSYCWSIRCLKENPPGVDSSWLERLVPEAELRL